MKILTAACFSMGLMVAGGSVYADDAMGKDAMAKDEMHKDQMHK